MTVALFIPGRVCVVSGLRRRLVIGGKIPGWHGCRTLWWSGMRGRCVQTTYKYPHEAKRKEMRPGIQTFRRWARVEVQVVNEIQAHGCNMVRTTTSFTK